MAAPIYEQPYVRIEVFEPHALLVTEWIGFALSDELRSALNEALRLARDYKITRWVADYRQRRIIAPEDQVWISTVWLPQLSTLGLKRLAIVESQNIFSRMSVNTIMTRASGHVTWDTRYFADRKEAEAWVLDL